MGSFLNYRLFEHIPVIGQLQTCLLELDVSAEGCHAMVLSGVRQ